MKSFILLPLTGYLSILFVHAQVMDSIPFELGKDNRVYLCCRINDSDKMDGVFGNNFLQRFHLTLDLQEGYIYLKTNNILYKLFYNLLIC